MNTATLPQSVVARLQKERARIENGAFCSAAGIGETLLSRQSGYRVLGQVMGSATFQAGEWTNPNWRAAIWRNAAQQAQAGRGYRYQLVELSYVMQRARALAMERLGAEMQLLGAQGVTGLRLRLQYPLSPDEDQVEFTAIGTAVRSDGAPAAPPFTSHLSGEQLWKLRRAGWASCELVMGNGVLLQTLARDTQRALGVGRRAPFEVAEYTDALYALRKTVMADLGAAARRSGAAGVVGVQVDIERHRRLFNPESKNLANISGEIFSMIALGTAVRPLPGTHPTPIQTVLDLS